MGATTSGITYGHAPHSNRLQYREGGHRAGATHADHDVLEARGLLLGREFVGDGPARELRRTSELVLIGVGIDLDDGAVDFVFQRVPALGHRSDVLLHVGHRGERLRLRMNAQPDFLQVAQRLGIRAELFSIDAHQSVEVDAERPRRGDAGILLPQCPRRRVARIGEERLSRVAELGVQAFEIRETQKHFAPDLQPIGRMMGAKTRRDRADRPNVLSHVLAGGAVSSGGAAHIASPFVGDRNRHAVDFRLTHETGLAPQCLDHPRIPRFELGIIEGVVERKKARRMLNRREKRGRDLAHALSRRIGGDQLRMAPLDARELPDELVILRIRHLWSGHDVIVVVMALDLCAQLFCT